MKYYLEWDPDKGELNFRKHKVSFPRAAEVFKDPHAISIFDEEHSHGKIVGLQLAAIIMKG